MLAAADAVIDHIDKKEIASALGFMVMDPEDEEEVAERKEMEKKKSILCQALIRKLRTIRKQLELVEGPLMLQSLIMC